MNATAHVKYMVLGAAAVLAVALVLGAPLTSVLPLATLLACPLMMVLMMATMGGGHGHGTRPVRDGRPGTTPGTPGDGGRHRAPAAEPPSR